MLAMVPAPSMAAASVARVLAATGGTTPAPPVPKAKPKRRFAHTGATSAGARVKKPVKVVHGAPVTSKTIPPPYVGPVYQRIETGEVLPFVAPPEPGQVQASTGGSPVALEPGAKPMLLVPGEIAREVNGMAAAPMSAPPAIQQMVWAGDQIVGLPYIFGGGHASFSSPGYDCSGTVSFALHGASLLATPMDSSEFMGWGSGGIGRWITVFSNPGHAYVDVAGLRLDTSSADDPTNQQGPRWRPLRPSNHGFVVRHPTGF
jgi:hypothetical protein